MPIASALSIEQITRRSWMVRSSTFASDTFTSPATTSPLSRILSRMSTSPCGCLWSDPRSSTGNRHLPLSGETFNRFRSPESTVGFGRGRFRRCSFPHLHWSERHVQLLVAEAERRLQLGHLFLELHEGVAETLDLFVREISGVHAPQGLLLEETPDELDDRQHELGQAVLDDLRIGRNARRDAICRQRVRE